MSKQTPAASRHTWPKHGGSRAHCFWQPSRDRGFARPSCEASAAEKTGAAYSSSPASLPVWSISVCSRGGIVAHAQRSADASS